MVLSHQDQHQLGEDWFQGNQNASHLKLQTSVGDLLPEADDRAEPAGGICSAK